MTISTDQIKMLRERTGAGMMDCKKALVETSGDIDQAIEWLRKKGLSKAAKKAGRSATEGLVSSYIHSGGKIGVLLEVGCETDFVARNQEFQNFVKDLAMHIAASAPLCVSSEDLPLKEVEAERRILEAKAIEEGKNKDFLDRMIEGQINKWKKTKILLEQSFVKDPGQTIQELLTATIARIGENIVIRRFVRYELGLSDT